MNSTRKLTILVLTPDIVGRVNASMGSTIDLLKRGHRVVFFTEESFKGRQESYGFEEYVYRMEMDGNAQQNQSNQQTTPKAGDRQANNMLANGIIGPNEPIDKFRNLLRLFVLAPSAGVKIKKMDKYIKKAIEDVQPDLIWVDNTYLTPAVYYSKIPWLLQISTTPTYAFFDETLQIPPGGSGYPTNDNDKSKWIEFNQVRREFFYSKTLNDYIEEMGYERYPNDIRIPETQLLTIYSYAEELNYPLFAKRKNWFNLECFNKNAKQERFELDPKFINDTLNGKWSGKWIYFSMGTMGSADLELMVRLLSILSTTNHKYVVSKGPKHEQIVLGSNMIGDRYVDQTRIIPFMDLIITHGGNNTVGETMTHGKPMIVLPLFADQFDNAQRIHETGFGIRLNPYKFSNENLLNAIDHLLNDQELYERMKNVSKRIRNTNRNEQLCSLIEQLLS